MVIYASYIFLSWVFLFCLVYEVVVTPTVSIYLILIWPLCTHEKVTSNLSMVDNLPEYVFILYFDSVYFFFFYSWQHMVLGSWCFVCFYINNISLCAYFYILYFIAFYIHKIYSCWLRWLFAYVSTMQYCEAIKMNVLV